MIAPAEFLLARIAEDEAVARAAALDVGDGAEGWNVIEIPYEGLHAYPRPSPLDGEGGLIPVSAHMQRHDPARVLAECEAKRRIIETHLDNESRVSSYRSPRWADAVTPADRLNRHKAEARCAATAHVVRILAQVYFDHPDYQPEWKQVDR